MLDRLGERAGELNPYRGRALRATYSQGLKLAVIDLPAAATRDVVIVARKYGPKSTCQWPRCGTVTLCLTHTALECGAACCCADHRGQGSRRSAQLLLMSSSENSP